MGRKQQDEKKKEMKKKMRSLGSVQKRAVQVLPPAPSWGTSSNVVTEGKVDAADDPDDPPEEELEDEIDENEELREWRDSFSFRKKKKRRRKDKNNQDEDGDYEQAKDEESDGESYSRSPLPKRGGPLMTEAEILANRKRRKNTTRGSEKVRERIAKEKERWERMKKYMPMDMPEKNMTYSQPRVGPGGGAPRRATIFSGRT